MIQTQDYLQRYILLNHFWKDQFILFNKIALQDTDFFANISQKKYYRFIIKISRKYLIFTLSLHLIHSGLQLQQKNGFKVIIIRNTVKQQRNKFCNVCVNPFMCRRLIFSIMHMLFYKTMDKTNFGHFKQSMNVS